MKKYLLLLLMIILLIGCLNKNNVKEKPKDFELWLVEAQEFSNKRKFNKAIDVLNEAQAIFGNEEIITITYNIGFNYYQLNNFDEAKVYLNRVLSLFENADFSQAQVMEYRKFVVLANVILVKIEEDKENRKDPYHIKEDIEKRKKIKAKKK